MEGLAWSQWKGEPRVQGPSLAGSIITLNVDRNRG